MTSSISTLGVQLLANSNLQNEQSNLSILNQQLASGQQNTNLTNYDPTSAHNLLNFQNSITQRQAYVSAMQNVNARLTVYNTTMNDMENIVQQAQTLAAQNQTLDNTTVSQLQATVQNYLKQATDDLNQEVGGRYIYAGSRYSTPPVTDLSTLTNTPTVPFSPTTSPTLPVYDSQYAPSASPPVTTSAAAFAKDSVTIDQNYSVTYGVTSNDPAFQQMVAGLQLINQATQPGVSAATYQANMANANTLLTTALNSLQGVNAAVAGNINTISQETTAQNTDITNLQNQISNISQVNVTQVGTEINLLQTQLQASYSATGSLLQESILKYL
jgi:flagellin-like hook-associated protein FlgL